MYEFRPRQVKYIGMKPKLMEKNVRTAFDGDVVLLHFHSESIALSADDVTWPQAWMLPFVVTR